MDLRVRHLVAGLVWLSAPPRWAGDVAVWETGAGPLRPTDADLRAAAVALERLAQRPAALAVLVGDAQSWLAARASALAVARSLALLAPADLPALENLARAGEPVALCALAALLTGASGWRELLALDPEAEGLAAVYLHACWVLGAAQEVPAGVRKALAQPVRMAAERDHLVRLRAATPGRADLGARLAALESRLADPAPLWLAAGREAADRLAQITAETQLAAAELLLEECFRARLAAIVGPLPSAFTLDDDLRNAVLLSADIRTNRDLLRQLLRAELAGERGWREALPANTTFLAGLATRGVDPSVWLAEHPVAYELPGVLGGRVTLAFEGQPLHVLQMGNYFGTCLGLGGGNAFSTVANVVDLNKRVIYARDAAGRVIGRKLIGVSTEWCLVGFHTYCSTGSPEADAHLPVIFTAYARDFAAACGLELADQGTIPTLVAAAWYDDGEIAWGDTKQMMNDNQHTRISKLLSYYLRHHPDELGLSLASGGWVAVDELLAALARRGQALTGAQLNEVVASNTKQRFAFDESGTRIRASQGHSVEVDLQLEPATPPAVLYHGTGAGSVEAIMREGLQRRSRHHVHLSADIATARNVGARHGPPAILVVDAAAMAAAGHSFFRSANGVWLADEVPPGFLSLLE